MGVNWTLSENPWNFHIESLCKYHILIFALTLIRELSYDNFYLKQSNPLVQFFCKKFVELCKTD